MWFCNTCKYPPCTECHTPREPHTRNRFQAWTCADCQKQDGRCRKQDDPWEASFANLRTVAQTYGGVPTTLPKRASANVKAARKFADEHIALHQKGRLEACKVKRFDDVVAWFWNKDDQKWEENYKHLKHVMAQSQGRVPSRTKGDAATIKAAVFAMHDLLGTLI